MGKPAKFSIVAQTRSILLIKDVGPWGEHFSITNDADGVVERLAPGLAGRRLFYFDSEGDFAELLVRDGRFAGFNNFPVQEDR